jgi:hypothetical protein
MVCNIEPTSVEEHMAGEVYKIEVAFDADGNSPWDCLWYDADEEDLDVLSCQMQIAAVWKPPVVSLERRNARPDFYSLHAYFVVTKRVRSLLAPLVMDTVEFLRLSIPKGPGVFVLHPLLRAELDKKAVITRNQVSGNITVIQEYSFPTLQEKMHCFQVRHPLGSSGRDAGFPYTDLLVSAEFKELCETNSVHGVVFQEVFRR